MEMRQRLHAVIGLVCRRRRDPFLPQDEAIARFAAPADHCRDSGLGGGSESGVERLGTDEYRDRTRVLEYISGFGRGEMKANRHARDAGFETRDIGDHRLGAVLREDSNATLGAIGQAVQRIGRAVEDRIQLVPADRHPLIDDGELIVARGIDPANG